MTHQQNFTHSLPPPQQGKVDVNILWPSLPSTCPQPDRPCPGEEINKYPLGEEMNRLQETSSIRRGIFRIVTLLLPSCSLLKTSEIQEISEQGSQYYHYRRFFLVYVSFFSLPLLCIKPMFLFGAMAGSVLEFLETGWP